MASKAPGSASAAPTTTSPPKLWPTATTGRVRLAPGRAADGQQVGDVTAQVRHPAAARALVAPPVVGHGAEIGQPAHDPPEAVAPVEGPVDEDHGGGTRSRTGRDDDAECGRVAHGQARRYRPRLRGPDTAGRVGPCPSSAARAAPSAPTHGWSTTCTTVSWPIPTRSARAGGSSSPTTARRRSRPQTPGAPPATPSRPPRRQPTPRSDHVVHPAPGAADPGTSRRPATPDAPPRRHRAGRGEAPTVLRGAASRDRRQHGGQPGRPDRDQCPHGAGPAARGQPPDPQQPAGPDHRGQGQLHPPHRVRRRPRAPRRARAQRRLRRRRRRHGQAGRRPPQARRASGSPSTRRRATGAARCWCRASGTPTRSTSAPSSSPTRT